MSPNWFLVVASLIAAGSVAVGVVRNRRFRRKERLHQQLAQRLGLKVAYLNERDFDLFGPYRSYSLRIEAFSLPDGKQRLDLVKVSLPMVNPSLKALRIIRVHEHYPRLSEHRRIDRPVVLDHQIAPWLEITTNDAAFAGLILSEDVKISLYDVFNRLETGLLYLQDEELTLLSPHLITEPERLEAYQRIADLLADMKDELN